MTRVAEVTVGFADTVHDVAYVRPGNKFRIGSAPGVDLAIALVGITELALVEATDERVIVRLPPDTRAWRNGSSIHVRELELAATELIELRFGAVHVAITLAMLPAASLPRPRLDRRTPGYLAVALLAHLLVWAIAMVFADPPPPAQAPIVKSLRRARIATREPVLRPAPQSPRSPRSPSPPSSSAPARTRTPDGVAVQVATTDPIEQIRDSDLPPGFVMPENPLDGPAALAKVIDNIHVAQRLAETGPLYDPSEHVTFGGGQRAFDPTHREGWGTIKTGSYQTVASGRAAGDQYSIEDEHERVHVRLCDGDCTAAGPLARSQIDYLLGYKLRAFATCYQPSTQELKLELVIAPDGKVRDARGPGRVGACAARIASAVKFPVAHDETRISYSLTFVSPPG